MVIKRCTKQEWFSATPYMLFSTISYVISHQRVQKNYLPTRLLKLFVSTPHCMLYTVTGPSRSPYCSGSLNEQLKHFYTADWAGNNVKAALTWIFTCYHLKIFSVVKYFHESPLAVQILVNNEECDLTSLVLCKCLLLITAANAATCTSWLRKKHMLWCHNCCISQMTLLRVPWHTNQSRTAVPCARRNAVQEQARSCRPGEDIEGKQQLGNRRRFGIWNWAWGYRWAFSETLTSLVCFSAPFKDKIPAGGSLIPPYLKCSDRTPSKAFVTLPWILDELITLSTITMNSKWTHKQ